MLETLITISLASRSLCVTDTHTSVPLECFKIASGCPAYTTPKGSFKVQRIYTNASLVAFHNNRNLGRDIIGSTLIDLGPSSVIPGTTFAIHGWHTPITSSMCSHSCIRMNTQDIKSLIQKYYFNKIIIE